MKKIRLLFLLLVPFFPAIAQHYDDKTTVVSVNYGIAVPLGKFASTDAGDSLSGFAIGGTNLNAYASYRVSENIAITGMISASSNRINESAYKQIYKPALDTLDGAISDFQSKKWYTVAYLGGVNFELPFKAIAIEARLLAGIAKTELPEVDVTIYSQHYTDAVRIVDETKAARAFCFNIGAGIRYTVSEIMFIGIHGDFFSTKQKYTDRVTVSSIADDSFHNLTRQVSLMNATFGIGFRF